MIKLLIGGSPCTYWSIAQKNNRETEASGKGWELFKNYLIAREKFKPDYFLYENNKSAAQPIKDQISRELGVDLMYINSALVSAQGDIVLTRWVLQMSNITLTRLINTLCRLLWTITPTSYNTAMLLQSGTMIGSPHKKNKKVLTITILYGEI